MTFIEVDLFEQATHVKVLDYKFPKLQLVVNKIYELQYKSFKAVNYFGQEYENNDYYITNERNQLIHPFPFCKTKLLKAV